MATAQQVTDCKTFLTSKEFADYAKEFPGSYRAAVAAAGLDHIASREDWPLEWEKLGWFCQYFWECLPHDPGIRHGAFFKVCEFAEIWCFG